MFLPLFRHLFNEGAFDIERITRENVAPLWVGGWGGRRGGEKEEHEGGLCYVGGWVDV
jgi:hypothetical protein